jgi:hypothetical protein
MEATNSLLLDFFREFKVPGEPRWLLVPERTTREKGRWGAAIATAGRGNVRCGAQHTEFEVTTKRPIATAIRAVVGQRWYDALSSRSRTQRRSSGSSERRSSSRRAPAWRRPGCPTGAFNFMSAATIWYNGSTENEIVLSDDFYREVAAHPIPVDLGAVRLLASSPGVLDLFAWLSYRCFTARAAQVIPLFGESGLAAILVT